MGKILSTINFRRFTILEMTEKTWKLSSRLQIEKLSENVFKFIFGEKKDREFIYRSRPWSLNRSLLILKEWPKESPLDTIDFDFTTFHVQIHGLPLIYLHEETSMSIGKQIGKIHLDSINIRSIMGAWYL